MNGSEVSACADGIIEHATALVSLPHEEDRRHVQAILENARRILRGGFNQGQAPAPWQLPPRESEERKQSQVSEYVVLQLKDGSEMLAEFRKDSPYPYRTAPRVYHATTAALAASAPIPFRDLWPAVKESVADKDLPDYVVRMVTRLLESRKLVHSKHAKFHVVPRFAHDAKELWKSLERRRHR